MFDRNQYINWMKAAQENASPDMTDFRNGYWTSRNVQQTGQNNTTGSLEDIIKNVTGSGNEVEVPQDSDNSMQLNELPAATNTPPTSPEYVSDEGAVEKTTNALSTGKLFGGWTDSVEGSINPNQLDEIAAAGKLVMPALAGAEVVGLGAKAAKWAKKSSTKTNKKKMKSSSQVYGGDADGTDVSSPDYSRKDDEDGDD